MKIVRVKIIWQNKTAAQLNKLLAGAKYSTVIKFEEDNKNWTAGAWSIILNKLVQDNTKCVMTGDMKFLSPDAPNDLLTINKKFELFEGKKCAAKGEIIE